MAKAFSHYSPIRKVGNLYFTAGHIGIPQGDDSAPLTIEDQTGTTLENLKNSLETVGLTLDDLVKVTVFLVNMDDYKAFNGVYADYIQGEAPARSAVAVKELPRIGENPILVEIEAVASKE